MPPPFWNILSRISQISQFSTPLPFQFFCTPLHLKPDNLYLYMFIKKMFSICALKKSRDKFFSAPPNSKSGIYHHCLCYMLCDKTLSSSISLKSHTFFALEIQDAAKSLPNENIKHSTLLNFLTHNNILCHFLSYQLSRYTGCTAFLARLARARGFDWARIMGKSHQLELD